MILKFDVADLLLDRGDLMNLNISHLDLVKKGLEKEFSLSLLNILGTSIPDYVASSLEKVCEYSPPQGVFYLVRRGGQTVGMGGLRPVRPGTVEMKRVYVPAVHRGHGIGKSIIERLIKDARDFGYQSMLLDTAPFQASAHRLYESKGLVDIDPYPEVEVPSAVHYNWRFMELQL
jgi:GNAT superfamily N-acetyltransferase